MLLRLPAPLATKAPGTVGSTSGILAFALVATLLLRACVNSAFAVWLFTRPPVWLDIFAAGATYSLADGALGLMTVFLLVRRGSIAAPPLLVAIILTDALLRCAAGIAILALPGIPYFPNTIVLVYGMLGTWAATAGVLTIVLWLAAHARAKQAGQPLNWRAHRLIDSLETTGLIAVILAGYAFIVGPPATAAVLRMNAGVASAALGLVFLIAALGAAAFPKPHAEG
jgi:hypothetical protein